MTTTRMDKRDKISNKLITFRKNRIIGTHQNIVSIHTKYKNHYKFNRLDTYFFSCL